MNFEPPKDYAESGQFIIELVPKLLAWAVGLIQLILLGLGAFGLSVLIDLKTDVRGYGRDISALNQRADGFDRRQDRFDERLGRVEAGERR